MVAIDDDLVAVAHGRDLARRGTTRGFYRKLPKVQEWAENNYYHLPIEPNTWMAIVRSSRRILDYTPVTEIMSRTVIYVEPDCSVDEALNIMTEKRIRHLPVIEKDAATGAERVVLQTSDPGPLTETAMDDLLAAVTSDGAIRAPSTRTAT